MYAHDEPEPHIDEKDLPRCKVCGSLARPGVVWFGEAPWFLDQIDELVDQADLCIVVGTSSTASAKTSWYQGSETNPQRIGLSSGGLRVRRQYERWEGSSLQP